MAKRSVPFAVDEWYHCFSRGIDKRIVFESPDDYVRFMQYLYLCNADEPLRRDNLCTKSNAQIFGISRSQALVSIATYCLMPNHFHLLLRETREGGISRFMQKIGTAYTMYFNIKNDRTGGLFTKPFRAKHIADDTYLQRVAQYIHLNPIELFESGWKSGKIKNFLKSEKSLRNYPFCSYRDYYDGNRSETSILTNNLFELFRETLPPARTLLLESAEYHQNLQKS